MDALLRRRAKYSRFKFFGLGFALFSVLFQHPLFLSGNLLDITEKLWKKIQIVAKLACDNVLEYCSL